MSDTISARIVNRNGKLYWSYSSGELLPYIAGGEGELPPEGAPAGITLQQPPAAPPPGLAPAAGVFVDAQGNLVDAQGQRLLPAQLVEDARRQEKDKLYPTLEQLKSEVSAMKAAEEERVRLEREAHEARERELQVAREADMDAKTLLEQRTAEWQRDRDALRAEIERERLLAQREREFAELALYRSQRLSELSTEIHPLLARHVSGNTREEIEASLAQAVADTARLSEEMQREMRPPPRPAGPYGATGGPGVNPGDLAGQPQGRTYSPEEIRNMSMGEYAQIRQQLLGAASDRVRQGGYGSV